MGRIAAVLLLFAVTSTAWSATGNVVEEDEVGPKLIAADGKLTETEAHARAGNADAQFALARHYFALNKSARTKELQTFYLDKTLAIAHRAAENGHAKSQFLLAACFRQAACGPDFKVSFAWMQRSANGGYPVAMAELAKIYLKGAVSNDGRDVGTAPRDPSLWLYWTLRAAEGGHLFSLAELTVRHYIGDELIQKDTNKALHFAKLAADRNSAAGFLVLGYIYFHGDAGQRVNYATALGAFERAADLGNRRAMYLAATMHYLGMAAARDHQKSFRLFRRAAEMTEDVSDGGLFKATREDLDNRANAGRMTAHQLMHAEGVEKNCTEVARWLEVAAISKSSDVVREVLALRGYAAVLGCGAPKNLAEARKLFSSARELGAKTEIPKEYLD